ncbi:MAG: hypothetical protein IH607_05055 [Firmicutes bacterium]|nr:hypothetical protein [Bacillota bacterium]
MDTSRQYQSMRFQNLRRKNYFEGWYYKQVSADERTVLSLIPGVSVTKGRKSYFMQAILAEKTDGNWRQTADWLDIEAFHAQNEPFALQLNGNRFQRDGISVSFQGKRVQASGTLRFGGWLAPPATRWSPTMMGPFAYLPGMECINTVISLSHRIDGTLELCGRQVDFTGGKGYIEKDWGSSFPKRYVWLQSNHFAGDAALFFSWADIPVLGMRFPGYVAHLFCEGKHYRFATYTQGRCELKTAGRSMEILLTNTAGELRIEAEQAAGADLLAPHKGRMIHTIKEGLNGKISFCLQLRGEERLYCDQTETAGVELVMEKGTLANQRCEPAAVCNPNDRPKTLDRKIPGHMIRAVWGCPDEGF